MIEKIAAHIADFTPRLVGNVKALYQYVPIPAINYPQLEEELFCNIYYLRHLCNEEKFPEWEIKEPVSGGGFSTGMPVIRIFCVLTSWKHPENGHFHILTKLSAFFHPTCWHPCS